MVTEINQVINMAHMVRDQLFYYLNENTQIACTSHHFFYCLWERFCFFARLAIFCFVRVARVYIASFFPFAFSIEWYLLNLRTYH